MNLCEPSATIPVSMLMAVYAGDDAGYLDQALRSIFDQTKPCAELVLVVDGPIASSLEDVISRYLADGHPTELVVLRTGRNRGLGAALNVGLARCRHDVVARMDSDDVSEPERIARQWDVFSADEDLAVLASWHSEFLEDDPNTVVAIKRAPARHEDIVRVLRLRNCISHPSIMARKAAMLEAGGYPEVRKLEDLHLFTRMARLGARFSVIQEPLVRVRVSAAQIARRGGLQMARDYWDLRFEAYSAGEYSLGGFLVVLAAWIPFLMAPVWVRSLMYWMLRFRPGSDRVMPDSRTGDDV